MEQNLSEALTITDQFQESDLKYIINRLDSHNLSISPTTQVPPSVNINFLLKDKDRILGGVLGRIYRYALFVSILWVSDELRGQGFGTKLLTMIEEKAKKKGCKLVHLDTYSFQAPEFYKKQGYEIFGILDGYPEGIKRYYLKKDL
jgi:ribosomal protein S18 acetylase RimI-like enzyme